MDEDADTSCESSNLEAIHFDFEEAISREEEERRRVLQSQGILRPVYNDGVTTRSASRQNKSEGRFPEDAVSTSNHGPAHREHSIVCRHWIRGMCWKGDFCEFLHQYDTGKMPLCRQFRKTGYCADRERGCCMFLHETTRNSEDTPLCIHYFLGFCRSGPRCRKRHQRLDVDSLPPLVPDWYLHLILTNARMVIPPETDPETEAVMAEVELLCRKLSGAGTAVSTDRAAASGVTTGLPGVTSLTSTAGGRMAARGCRNGTLVTKTQGTSAGQELDADAEGANGRIDENNRSGSRGAGSFGTLSTCAVTTDVLHVAEEQGIPRLPGSPTAAEQAGKTRVFMIKSSDLGNIHTSIRLGVWATGKKNTRLLEDAFHNNQHVVLLFSGNETGGFQGYARMTTPTIPGLYSSIWGSFSVRLGGNFRVQWLKQCKVEFEKFGSLVNPLNSHQCIRKSRDCQEFPLREASIICTVLDREPDVELLDDVKDSKSQPKIDHATFFALSEPERVQKEIELCLRDPETTVVPPSQILRKSSRQQMSRDHSVPTTIPNSPLARGLPQYSYIRPPPPPPFPPQIGLAEPEDVASDVTQSNSSVIPYGYDEVPPVYAHWDVPSELAYAQSSPLSINPGHSKRFIPLTSSTASLSTNIWPSQLTSSYYQPPLSDMSSQWGQRSAPYHSYSSELMRDSSMDRPVYAHYSPWPPERRVFPHASSTSSANAVFPNDPRAIYP